MLCGHVITDDRLITFGILPPPFAGERIRNCLDSLTPSLHTAAGLFATRAAIHSLHLRCQFAYNIHASFVSTLYSALNTRGCYLAVRFALYEAILRDLP